MSIKVTVFPASSRNPYVTNFYSGIDSKDVHVTGESKLTYPPESDVLHIQWPEAWMWINHDKKSKLKYIFKCLRKRKSIDLKVVNTVHNLKPHKKQTLYQNIVYWYILWNCDGFIHLTEAGRELFFKKHFWAKFKRNTVIYHPNYKYQLTNLTKNEAREKLGLCNDHLRIVFFGRILPYKGVNKLISSYLESPYSIGSSLWIGGPSDEESTEEIGTIVSGEHSIEFSPGFVDDAHLELQVKAADWVVLPYLGGLNSGVAVYALSCGTSAVVPDSPVMREMEGVTKSTSFKYFSDSEFREVLDSVLKQGRVDDPAPDTTMLNSEIIGEQYHSFLSSL